MRFDFKIDAAIFDNDGTLMDTMPYWRYTTLEFLLAHQMPVPNEMLVSMYDSSSRKLLTQICEETGVTDLEDAISEVEGYMHRHYLYDAKLKCPAVPELLRRLKAGGARLCVATAAPREYVSDGLRRLGILDFFDFVTDNRECAYKKRQPEYFTALLERLGASADRTWVFEDALYAMESAKAAGLRVCAIEENTQRKDREAIMALADVYVRDYIELFD